MLETRAKIYALKGMGMTIFSCVLVYRYTKERDINELRHNSIYAYENNRNCPVYRYTRTASNISIVTLWRHF